MALMNDDGEVDMGEYCPPSKLPEGVKKEVLSEADEKQWRTPKTGDDVKVHYAGCLEDGTEFDSSYSRDAPVVFCLGKGEVIKGWDLAIATMKKGEKAKITIAPEYAYGEKGSPPKIPPSATLVFTVELISWVAKDDLFGDGLVTKSQLKEGSGYENPSEGKEVRLNFRVAAENEEKTVLQEKFGFDYVLGSGDLAPFTKVVDKALSGMNKEEIVSLRCEPGAVADFAPNASEVVNIELSFEEEYVITDCSFAKDGSVMKKQIKEGESWEKPADGKQVTLMVECVKDEAGRELAGFTGKELRFVAGDGAVCDALEMAALEMKRGERALVTCRGAKRSCREPQLGLGKIDADTVVLVLEMRDFRRAARAAL
jgi:FKBP-type peptidyl-prolyl cis-trans isomerase 2